MPLQSGAGNWGQQACVAHSTSPSPLENLPKFGKAIIVYKNIHPYMILGDF